MGDIGDLWFYQGKALNKWIAIYADRIAGLEASLAPEQLRRARVFFGPSTIKAFEAALASGDVETQKALILAEIERLKNKLASLQSIKVFLERQQKILVQQA